jgi:hypothetical protein
MTADLHSADCNIPPIPSRVLATWPIDQAQGSGELDSTMSIQGDTCCVLERRVRLQVLRQTLTAYKARPPNSAFAKTGGYCFCHVP